MELPVIVFVTCLRIEFHMRNSNGSVSCHHNMQSGMNVDFALPPCCFILYKNTLLEVIYFLKIVSHSTSEPYMKWLYCPSHFKTLLAHYVDIIPDIKLEITRVECDIMVITCFIKVCELYHMLLRGLHTDI